MRLPSAAYEPANARGMGRASGIPPSTAIVQRRRYELAPGVGTAPRVDANRICLPSGVHPRTKSAPGWNVRRLGFPPDTGSTYTSAFPATVAVYAIIDPSGENRGSVSADGVLVSRRAFPPARGTTHRSPPYSNAIISRLTVGRRRNRVPCAGAVANGRRSRITAATCGRRGCVNMVAQWRTAIRNAVRRFPCREDNLFMNVSIRGWDCGSAPRWVAGSTIDRRTYRLIHRA